MSGFAHFDEALFNHFIPFLSADDHISLMVAIDKTMRAQVPEQYRFLSRRAYIEFCRRRALSDCIRETLPSGELDVHDRYERFIKLYAEATLAHYSRYPDLLMKHRDRAFYVNLWRSYKPSPFDFSIEEDWRYFLAKRPFVKTAIGSAFLFIIAATVAMLLKSFEPVYVGCALLGLWVGFSQISAYCARRAMRLLTNTIEVDFQLRFACALNLPKEGPLRAAYAMATHHRDGYQPYMHSLVQSAIGRFETLSQIPSHPLSQDAVVVHLREESALSKAVMIELLRIQASRISSTATSDEWRSFVRYCKSFNFEADDLMRCYVSSELERLPKRYGWSVAVGVSLAVFAAAYVNLLWFSHFIYHHAHTNAMVGSYVGSSALLGLLAWPILSRWYKSREFDQNAALSRQYRLVSAFPLGLSHRANHIARRFRLGRPATWRSMLQGTIDDVRTISCFRGAQPAERQGLLGDVLPV